MNQEQEKELMDLRRENLLEITHWAKIIEANLAEDCKTAFPAAHIMGAFSRIRLCVNAINKIHHDILTKQ